MGMRILILNYNVFYVFYLYKTLRRYLYKKLFMFNKKLLVKII